MTRVGKVPGGKVGGATRSDGGTSDVVSVLEDVVLLVVLSPPGSPISVVDNRTLG